MEYDEINNKITKKTFFLLKNPMFVDDSLLNFINMLSVNVEGMIGYMMNRSSSSEMWKKNTNS